MTEHYYSPNPQSRQQEHTFTENICGETLELTTDSSVFSASKIDTGTRILLENVRIYKNWHVLDLGCGYGAVGVTLAKAHPDLQVVLSDVNARAVKLARKNAAQNNVVIKEITSDGFEHITEQFDTILLNPPQTAGKKVCERLIVESEKHIVSGGLFQLVARHNKGGAQFEKFMKEVFGNVEQTAKQSGFRVYVSRKEKLL